MAQPNYDYCINSDFFDFMQSLDRNIWITFKGTNAFFWVVYAQEIDVTFVVIKRTKTIGAWKHGKHEYLTIKAED
jgi:hypothetical protein